MGQEFEWWSEYQTKFNLVFNWHSKTGQFGDRTTFDHLNTRLLLYSDLNCSVTCPMTARPIKAMSPCPSLMTMIADFEFDLETLRPTKNEKKIIKNNFFDNHI